jgi:hypothetical protein
MAIAAADMLDHQPNNQNSLIKKEEDCIYLSK